MATTTNYGWTTPDDTALVKDGASAIRSLGTAVDTTTKNLNPSTTLGDIEYRSSTANTNTRLAIGTTGQVLTVAGGVPSWATPAGAAGMTEIATGTMSGSTFSLTSFSGYNNLQIVLRNYYGSSGGTLRMRLNNDSSSTAYYYGVNANAQDGQTGINFNNLATDGVGTNSGFNNALINIYDYAQTSGYKLYDLIGSYQTASGTQTPIFTVNGVYESTSALTSIDFVFSGGGTFSGGTYILYGVK